MDVHSWYSEPRLMYLLGVNSVQLLLSDLYRLSRPHRMGVSMSWRVFAVSKVFRLSEAFHGCKNSVQLHALPTHVVDLLVRLTGYITYNTQYFVLTSKVQDLEERLTSTVERAENAEARVHPGCFIEETIFIAFILSNLLLSIILVSRPLGTL